MNEFWSEGIRHIKPYTPGEQPRIANLIKLNTNENPFGPSPKVIAAIQQATGDSLKLYPDPDGTALKQTIADMHGLSPAHVFLGNGSDEVLAHAFLGLFKHPLPIIYPDITYSFYPVYCSLYAIAYKTIALDENFQVNIADYAIPNGGIVLSNPNAPTASALSRETLFALLKNNPQSVVVIDEAYIDFGAESVIPLIKEFPNLLVIQTLSKGRSLAGLRVGFALGDPGIIAALTVVKDSFNSYPLDRLSLAGAQAALLDAEYFDKTRLQVMKNRDFLIHELTALGFYVLPSLANFVFASHTSFEGSQLQKLLRDRKILVRHFALPRIAQFLRISIGTIEECTRLVEVLKEIV